MRNDRRSPQQKRFTYLVVGRKPCINVTKGPREKCESPMDFLAFLGLNQNPVVTKETMTHVTTVGLQFGSR